MFSLFSYNLLSSSFFFNDTATTEIYTLSLHDALPICLNLTHCILRIIKRNEKALRAVFARSEEHTSELQSRLHLVCRLLLAKNTAPATERAGHIGARPLRSGVRRRPGW